MFNTQFIFFSGTVAARGNVFIFIRIRYIFLPRIFEPCKILHAMTLSHVVYAHFEKLHLFAGLNLL